MPGIGTHAPPAPLVDTKGADGNSRVPIPGWRSSAGKQIMVRRQMASSLKTVRLH